MYKQYKLLILKKAPPPVTYKQKKCELAGRVSFPLPKSQSHKNK